MHPALTSAEPVGLYLSVPFCRSKCTFCNFASGVYSSRDLPRYVARLIADMRTSRHQAATHGLILPQHVDTIYFGGGTPSILTAAQLGAILTAAREEFTLLPGAEITLEAAPSLLPDELLAAAATLGVSRVSFGVQTFVDAEARAIGRLHTAAQALDDLARVRQAGIPAVSLDLIAGLPGQTQESWRHSLAMLGEAAPEHASVYMLEVDEDSRLGGEMLLGGSRYGAALTPSDDAVADFYAEACETLAGQGLAQYEISNFARPGRQSLHNLRYWDRRPYLGLGLDAHSMLRNQRGQAVRFGVTDDLQCYLQAPLGAAPLDRDSLGAEPRRSGLPDGVPGSPGSWGELSHLTPDEELEEAWFLGLRRNAGVSLPALRAAFGSTAVDAFTSVLATLVTDGLIELTDAEHAPRSIEPACEPARDWARDLAEPATAKLTARGRMISNDVFARFLDRTDPALADLSGAESSPSPALAL